MTTYQIELSKTEDNGETWKVQRIEITGYLAALRVAKALSGARNGGVLIRNLTTGRGRLIWGAK